MSNYLFGCPESNSKERDDWLLKSISDGRYKVEFVPLHITHKTYKATFYVMNDALKIDGIRINASAHLEQLIANKLGCLLLTAKLCDYIWNNADIRIQPCPTKITSTTKAMIDHSLMVDKKLTGSDTANKLLSTVGKDWILGSSLKSNSDVAINCGWHFSGKSCQGISGSPNESKLKDSNGNVWKLIQPPSTMHNKDHSDYSQVVRLVARECYINGECYDLAYVLRHEEMSYIVSNSGPLEFIYQPGSEEPNYNFVVNK